jgi:hypothetical protein
MVSKNKKSQNSNLILFAPKGVYRSLTQLCHAKIAGPDPAEQKEPHVASTFVTRQGRERRTECVSVGTTGQSVPVCVCVCVCVCVRAARPPGPSCVLLGRLVRGLFLLVGGRLSLGGSQRQQQQQTTANNKNNNTTTAAATTITPQRQPQRQPQQQEQQQQRRQLHLSTWTSTTPTHTKERGGGGREERQSSFVFAFCWGGGRGGGEHNHPNDCR